MYLECGKLATSGQMYVIILSSLEERTRSRWRRSFFHPKGPRGLSAYLSHGHCCYIRNFSVNRTFFFFKLVRFQKRQERSDRSSHVPMWIAVLERITRGLSFQRRSSLTRYLLLGKVPRTIDHAVRLWTYFEHDLRTPYKNAYQMKWKLHQNSQNPIVLSTFLLFFTGKN